MAPDEFKNLGLEFEGDKKTESKSVQDTSKPPQAKDNR